MTPPSTRIRFHTRPAQLDVGGVVRVTNLTPAELAQLEQFLQATLGAKRYLP